ncbi:MAG TPA: hypothetical protein VG738_22455 [Chitinophagaceae bacterium]|nr:hypothetical protein [Chitinophagaceae bacterium]
MQNHIRREKWLKYRFLIAFVVITLTGACCYQLWLENHVYGPGAWQHALAYVCLIVVGASGYYAWLALDEKWPAMLWLVLYLVVLITFGVYHGINIFTHRLIYKVNPLFDETRKLFMSPMPFTLFYIFIKKTGRLQVRADNTGKSATGDDDGN